jgi:hypothetical protein
MNNSSQAVFGHDVKFDADGKPIETGIGSLHANSQLLPKTSRIMLEHVFGKGVKLDADGTPIEQGIGSTNEHGEINHGT